MAIGKNQPTKQTTGYASQHSVEKAANKKVICRKSLVYKKAPLSGAFLIANL